MTTWRDFNGIVHECDRQFAGVVYYDTRCLYAMAIREQDVTGIVEPITCLFCMADARWSYVR